jgi:branched-subunit amino acid transport protein
VTWIALFAGAAACYASKLAGLSVPERILERPLVQRTAAMLPVALLAALIATQTFSQGHRLTLDARAAGLAAAAIAQARRAPFIVVVVAAAATTAILRLAG